jgi:uncharacterized protein
MAAKFEIKKTATGKFHFNLKAANGEVILSSEVYESKGAAESGIASVKTNALQDAQFERKTSAKNEPFFVLKAVNQQVIGRSEMYSSAAGCENGIASVKKNAAEATISDLTEV